MSKDTIGNWYMRLLNFGADAWRYALVPARSVNRAIPKMVCMERVLNCPVGRAFGRPTMRHRFVQRAGFHGQRDTPWHSQRHRAANRAMHWLIANSAAHRASPHCAHLPAWLVLPRTVRVPTGGTIGEQTIGEQKHGAVAAKAREGAGLDFDDGIGPPPARAKRRRPPRLGPIRRVHSACIQVPLQCRYVSCAAVAWAGPPL